MSGSCGGCGCGNNKVIDLVDEKDGTSSSCDGCDDCGCQPDGTCTKGPDCCKNKDEKNDG